MARDDTQRELDQIRRAAFELRARDPNEAVKVLRRAVRSGGQWEALAHGALGEILLEDFHDIDGALHHFERLRTLAPGLPAGELGLARTLVRDARFDEAQLAYARAQQGLEKTLTGALDAAEQTQGASLEGIEETVLTALEAAVEEREMLRESPTGRPASTPSATLLDLVETARVLDIDEGEEEEEEAPTESDTEDWDRYTLLRAAMLSLDGDVDQALAFVERVGAFVPLTEATIARAKSLVFEAAGRWAEAAGAIETLVSDPATLPAQEAMRLAELLTGAGRESDARHLLEKVKSTNAGDEELVKEIDSRLEELPKPSIVTLGLGRGRLG